MSEDGGNWFFRVISPSHMRGKKTLVILSSLFPRKKMRKGFGDSWARVSTHPRKENV